MSCFTTACQPAPDAALRGRGGEAVGSVALSAGAMENGAANAPAGASGPLLRETLGAPAHWTEDPVTKAVPKAELTVQVDADVHVPDVAQAAVFSATGLSDGGALARKLVAGLFGDRQLYVAQNDALKRDVQGWIDYMQSLLAETQADPEKYGEMYEDMVADYQNRLKEYVAEYEKAPEDYSDLVPWDGNAAAEALNIMASTGEPGCYARLEIYPPYQISYTSGVGVSNMNYWATPKYAPETEEERSAIAAAEAFVQEMDLTQFRFYSIVPGLSDNVYKAEQAAANPMGYIVTLVPYYGGMPLYALAGRIGSDTAVQGAEGGAAYYDDSQYGRVPDPEIMTLNILDGAVVRMQYNGPTTVTETGGENVQLLPFADIQQRFMEQIFENYYLDAGYAATLHITDVTLSMMRVMKKDAPGEYSLLPVWDFTGYDVDAWIKTDAELQSRIAWWNGQSMMTLSAVDGSVINRYLGY